MLSVFYFPRRRRGMAARLVADTWMSKCLSSACMEPSTDLEAHIFLALLPAARLGAVAVAAAAVARHNSFCIAVVLQ